MILPIPAVRKTLYVLGLITALVAQLCAISHATAQEESATKTDDLRSGKSFISTPTYSLQQDQTVLKLFDRLRVADVSDGMDAVGLQNVGLVDSEVQPLWKDTEKYTHRFVGIAVTARYVPSQRPPAGALPTVSGTKSSRLSLSCR